jgi:alginate production protein
MKWLLCVTWMLLCCAAGVQAQPVAPAVAETPTVDLARRPDERRSEQAVRIDLLGTPVELGFSYQVEKERRGNFDLDGTRQRGRDVTGHELQLDARWRAGAQTTFFVQAVGLSDRRRAWLDGAVQQTHEVERGQTWVLLQDLGGLPLSLQLGRMAWIDRRSWWWDDDLDALRLSWRGSGAMPWRIDTGLAREVLKRSSRDAGIAPELKGLWRWLGHATVNRTPDHDLEGFWLLHADHSGAPAPGSSFTAGSEDPADARLLWLGLRSSGAWRLPASHRLSYRADLALVQGRETLTAFRSAADGRQVAGAGSRRRVRGQAWDVGLQWRLPGLSRPTFSLGLANGSGGADNPGLDRSFRQTGLQENKSRIGGVKRWRLYGELLDPELSNLRVASLGFGLRLFGNNSAEVVWHHYRQNTAARVLAGSRLSTDPQGLNRDIGRELDLLFALREWRNLELTLKLARFAPGAAFADNRRDRATSVELGATLTY